MIVKGDYSLLIEDINLSIPQSEDQTFLQNEVKINSQSNVSSDDSKENKMYRMEVEIKNDPRQHFPTYAKGNYKQNMSYFIKDDKVPLSKNASYYIALPKHDGYGLMVESLELRCSDCTVSVNKNQIEFSNPIIFDYSNNIMRIMTPTLIENRILLKDGSSVVNGYKLLDFDNNDILIKNKATLKVLINDMRDINNLAIFGDYNFITFENDIFNGKNIKIKVRGFSKINLGESNVKSVEIDSQMASVNSSKINK